MNAKRIVMPMFQTAHMPWIIIEDQLQPTEEGIGVLHIGKGKYNLMSEEISPDLWIGAKGKKVLEEIDHLPWGKLSERRVSYYIDFELIGNLFFQGTKAISGLNWQFCSFSHLFIFLLFTLY